MACHANIWGIELVYSHLGTLSLFVAIFSGIAHVVYYLIKGMPLTLNATLGKMLAGFVLPPAIAMAASAFDPANLLGCVNDLPIYILAGSVSAMWITFSVLFPGGFTWKWIQELGKRFGRPNSPP